ncbi:MAG TPA: helix-turn-helix domain-containing protein [Streptosporangiaceae bacterium]|nr:helix-turn-helix domain-containing protein [Streptosporangiaceae bacterium]
MPHRQPLSARQLNVLKWIADGCPDRDWPDESHKNSARALESRGLARVRRKGKLWHAVLSADGRHYLERGRYPEPPAAGLGSSRSLAASGRTAEEASLVTARQAIRQATTSQERRSLGAARARAAQRAAHPSLLKDIPMRYKIVVSRVQTAERHVRGVSEEDATRKVQEELERPYGFLGGWTTIGTDMDIVTVESALGDTAPAQISQDGSFLLSVKAASKYLGLSTAVLYELINRGEIAHVMIGSRRYVSRDQISAFVQANTHTGYYPKR